MSNHIEFYREQGVTIELGDYLILGIHPDNLDNNLSALINGDMKINYTQSLESFLEVAKKVAVKRINPSLTIRVKGRLAFNVNFDTVSNLKNFLYKIDNGYIEINWNEVKRISSEDHKPFRISNWRVFDWKEQLSNAIKGR